MTDGRVLSWSWDGTLRLWGADGALLKILSGHTGIVYGAQALSDGCILSWSNDQTLRLWGADGVLLAVLEGHADWVTGALVLADGRFLSWSDDKKLRLWAADGAPLAVLQGHTHWVNGAQVLADGRILSLSVDHMLRLWASDGTPLAVLEKFDREDRDRVSRWAEEHGLDPQILFSRPENGESARLLTAKGNKIMLYQSANGQPIGQFYADADITTEPVFLADGITIAAGDAGGRVLFLRCRDS